jgi:pimeloyl-ACP methyl ester carboxylesterase
MKVYAEYLYARADEVGRNPESMIRALLPDLAVSDRRVVEERAMRGLLTETYAEAVRAGGDGWVDDAIAQRSPWGFKFSSVTCPVLLWHGADDRFVPVSHTNWLADQLRSTRVDPETVEVQIAPGAAHFGAVEVLPEILSWVSRPKAF